MSENKRRWFQIHLSTAVFVMLAAAFFVYLNTRPHIDFTNFGSNPSDLGFIEHKRFGWPEVVVVCDRTEHWTGQKLAEHIHYRGLLINVACLVGSAGLLAVGMEMFIRRSIEKSNEKT